MADAIVSFAAERLGDLLIQEAKFLYGVSDKVENIKTELKRMQCFLKDADSKASNGDERVSNWLAEIRDLAYDAEDVIETYALKVASRRREGIINVLKRYACILNEGKTLHKVGSEIEAITAKISNLTSSLRTYDIKELNDGSSSSAHQRPPSYSHVAEPYFVGRDESVKELVMHLVDNEKKNRIVSIWGMGGLGKTTLAKKVYHHPEIKRRFDHFSWSCISQKCQARNAWEGILFELISPSKEQREEITKWTDGELTKKLDEVLREKRCLVILDDIWHTQDWNNLIAAFSYEETNSKILLTTRHEGVALNANPTGFHYNPQCLDEEESWDLLHKIAIPEKDGADFRIDRRMEALGKEMVKHCGGLPLAVTVLGGLLATKYSSHEWHTVNETIKSCLRRGKGPGSGVSDVLALSYNDLPTELKPCFLYLSHFPDDYEIYVDKLIQLWVAEGIIKSEQHSKEGEETLEDVAERYLNELVKRCMVLVGERNSRIISCCMHDLMRDFCLLKAKEENFVSIVEFRNGDENVDNFSSSSRGKIRRLAIYDLHQSCNESLLKGIKNPHLRSILCFFAFGDKEWSLEMPVFNNLKLLRVLDVEGQYNMGLTLPKDIGKLVHLRHLSLKNTNVRKLPSSLGNLRCLQTLNLLIEVGIVHVPNVLWKLEGLRHLYLPDECDDKTKLRLGNLRSLQTLVNFSFKNFDVSELLNNMTNLRKLSVQHLYLIKDFGEKFKSRGITLQHLRSLTLDSKPSTDETIDVGLFVSGCTNLYKLNIEDKIEKLPNQLPASITDIHLFLTGLEEDPMITLEKLPHLKTLTLSLEAFTGKQLFCSREGFPRLHFLRLVGLNNLEEWRVDEGALPNLCHLDVMDCSRLKRLPDGLRFVKTLKELVIRWMPKEFKEKLEEGGEEFYKVQHVPSVKFQDIWGVEE